MPETKVNSDRVVTLAQSDALKAMPALNPQALIALALDKGAGIETLERLVALAKDMRAIVAKEAYNEAISEFQRRCPPIKKNKSMVVPGRPTYRYADLGEILPTISPLMGELGLSVSWHAAPSTKQNVVATVCRLSHKLGHSEDSGPCEIPYSAEGGRMNGAQAVGSAKTYAKRYSLTDVLGISPEDDDDANGSHGGETRGGGTSAPRRSSGSVATTTAPTSPPDEATIEAESRALFAPPEEAEERASLMARAQKIIRERKLSKMAVGKLKLEFLGDENADVFKADLAGLAAVVRHLEVVTP